jgi:hypothetical protein
LVSEQKKAGSKGPSVAEVAIETDWDAIEMEMNLDMDDPDLLDQCFDIPQLGMDAGMSSLGPEFFSQELLGLGLQEPLPPQEYVACNFLKYCNIIIVHFTRQSSAATNILVV